LKVVVQPNGAFDIVASDGDWNETYSGLGLLLDSGDNGDGYTFSQPPFNRVVSSVGAHPRISKVGTGVGLQQIRIEYDFEIPVSLDDARHRRRDETIACPTIVDLILREGSKRLEIEITFDNRARDHRLQMSFPTGFRHVKEASSAMQFDVVTRPVKPEPIAPDDWWVEDPPETFPMHSWMDLCKPDSSSGLCLIAQGLHEFEIDVHADSTDVSLTLLRAVGYLGARRDPTTILGGAGPGIPTPEAQLQQILHYRIALYPHQGSWDAADASYQAQSFLTPPRVVTTVPHTGDLNTMREGLIVSGSNVVLSSLKQSEDRQAVVIRLYNPSNETTQAIVDFPIDISAAHTINLQEQPIDELPVENNNKIMCIISAKKVVTLKVQSASFGS
jgi:alpha-mannosidase